MFSSVRLLQLLIFWIWIWLLTYSFAVPLKWQEDDSELYITFFKWYFFSNFQTKSLYCTQFLCSRILRWWSLRSNILLPSLHLLQSQAWIVKTLNWTVLSCLSKPVVEYMCVFMNLTLGLYNSCFNNCIQTVPSMNLLKILDLCKCVHVSIRYYLTYI